MKAIVTGATGFIGSAFVDYLSCRGIQVLALGRKQPGEGSEARWEKIQSAPYLNIDMDQIKALPEKLHDIGWKVGGDCVFFHLAWGGRLSLSDLDISAQLRNVDRSVSALEVAKQIGCSRFIQVGTMEEAFTQEYLKFDHHINAQYNRHAIYSVAKMAARRALSVKASELKIDFIYVFHSHVMGPNDDKDSLLQVTLRKLMRGDELIFSSGEQYFDVISVEDCVYGYFLICEKGRPGKTYWVGSGEPLRLKEYIERMYALFPSTRKMEFGKLPYNDVVLDKLTFSIDRLVEDTGYKPTMTYEQTVRALHEHLLALETGGR